MYKMASDLIGTLQLVILWFLASFVLTASAYDPYDINEQKKVEDAARLVSTAVKVVIAVYVIIFIIGSILACVCNSKSRRTRPGVVHSGPRVTTDQQPATMQPYPGQPATVQPDPGPPAYEQPDPGQPVPKQPYPGSYPV